MIWSTSLVCWGRRVAFYGLGPPGWNASIITRSPSFGWSSGMPLGWQEIVLSALRNFTRVRPVWCIGGIYWACLLSLPSHAATVQASWRLHGLHLGWKVFFIFLSWKLVLCAAIWYRSWTGRNIVFLCLLGIMWVMVWMMRMKEFPGEESFSPQTLVSYYKHQIKVKIWERLF